MFELMKYSLNYQFYISKQEQPDEAPKYCSLLTDLVPIQHTQKFNSKHLKDYSFSFSKKYVSNVFSDGPISEDSLTNEKTFKDFRNAGKSFWKEDDDDYVAQTIDLDERKDDKEHEFFSTAKLKQNRTRLSKAETMMGTSFKRAEKGKDTSPVSRLMTQRRDSGISSQSMMRLQSYRSIQHEPSHQEKSEAVRQANYSALKSQIDRFSNKFECASVSQVLTMKRNNSEEPEVPGRNFKIGEKSQFNTKSMIDYDESCYNVFTMKEKGYLADSLPIRAGCFSPDGMYFCVGTNSKCLKI